MSQVFDTSLLKKAVMNRKQMTEFMRESTPIVRLSADGQHAVKGFLHKDGRLLISQIVEKPK